MKDDALFYLDGHGPFTPKAVLGLTRLYGVNEDGSVSANSIPFDLERVYAGEPKAGATSSIRELQTGSAILKLGAGAGCLFGKPYSGKSLFADTMARRNPGTVSVIRFREPENDSLMYERSLVAQLWKDLNSAVEVIFVDSLRTTFYMAGGATGKGGVNMGIYPLLTTFDMIAKRFDKVIVFALNPMTTDDDAIQFYLEAAKGSVAHTLHATQPLQLTVSSRSMTNRDDYRQKYQPVPAASLTQVLDEGRPPLDAPRTFDSIVDLYVLTSR